MVKCSLERIVYLCEEAKGARESLVCLMFIEEHNKKKQNTWFGAKILIENSCIADVEQWLKDDDAEGNPYDSITNVASRYTQRKSECSGKSDSIKSSQTTASAGIKAEAERAALIAPTAVLIEKHALEAQEEQLRKRMELLEIEAKIFASVAKQLLFQAASECKWLTNTFGWRLYHM